MQRASKTTQKFLVLIPQRTGREGAQQRGYAADLA